VQAGTISRILLANDRLTVGEFRYSPDNSCWHSLNSVSAEPHVIFPGTAATIRQLGREPVIGDRNQVLFYNPGQRFFRSPTSRNGDHCYYMELSSELMFRLSGGLRSFPFAFGPCEASVFLLQRLAIRHLKEPDRDPSLAEHALTLAIESAIGRTRGLHSLRARQREATRAAHREIVDQTKQLLIARFRERLTMAEVAASLGMSQFQAEPGLPLLDGVFALGYRNQLRLRAALDRLADPALGFPPSPKTSVSRTTLTSRRPSARPSGSSPRTIGRETLSAVVARHAPARDVPLSSAAGRAQAV
jgi:AraC-like DNA-binding protein